MSRFIFKSATIMGLSTFISRILGFIRDMVIANFIGAGNQADAFFVAFRIPNLLRRLFGEGSLTVAFIPVFTKYKIEKGKDEADIIASISFTLLIIILLIITSAGVIFSPFIIKILAPGFEKIPEKFILSVKLNRIMFPYIFFISIVALCMGILNSYKHFFAPSIAPVFLNISMICSCIIGYILKKEIVFCLAWGVLIGGFLQLILQMIYLKKFKIKLRINFNFFHPAIKEIAVLMGPSILGLAVTQIQIFFNTLLASFLESGSISYLYYADRLIQFPLGIFAVSIGNAILPLISEHKTKKNFVKIEEDYLFSIKLILLISIPALIGLIISGKLIISVLFQRGAFTINNVYSVYSALVAYSFGLWAYSGIRVLTPVFYAFEDTKTPVKIAFLALIINVLASLLLMHYISYTGLALATSISSSVNFLILCKKLKNYIDIEYKKLFKFISKILLAGSIMGIFLILCLSYFNYLKFSLPVKGGFLLLIIVSAVSIFIIACNLLNIPEIKYIIEKVKR